jgi:hypothetical protein
VAKNIKNQETSFGSEAPRILALDDYFECDGEVSFSKKYYFQEIYLGFSKIV